MSDYNSEPKAINGIVHAVAQPEQLTRWGQTACGLAYTIEESVAVKFRKYTAKFREYTGYGVNIAYEIIAPTKTINCIGCVLCADEGEPWDTTCTPAKEENTTV